MLTFNIQQFKHSYLFSHRFYLGVLPGFIDFCRRYFHYSTGFFLILYKNLSFLSIVNVNFTLF
jgi:hypothetical protein